jgi:hippurate hydrolase
MHNMPGAPVGAFAIRGGPLLASSDDLTIKLTGRGGHAAQPHRAVDSVLAASAIVMALQQVVARNADPLAPAVLTVTSFRSGSEAWNIIPETVELRGTARTLDPATQDLIEERIRAVAEATAAAYGARVEISYRRGYPVTANAAAEADFAARVAAEVVGEARVDTAIQPVMGAEDFSFMLNARPGAFILIGNGDSANLHHPGYDFNDEAIPVGASYWARLVETAMPATPG